MNFFGFNPFFGGFPSMLFDPSALARFNDPWSQGSPVGNAWLQPPSDTFQPTPGYNPGAAFGMPNPPNPEVTQRFNAMHREHRTQQQANLGKLEDRLEARRDEVFAHQHYDMGEDGKPRRGENGNPILLEGGESAEQRNLRRNWERGEKLALQARHEQEKQRFLQSAQEEARGLTGPRDPSQMLRMHESYTRLEAAEQEMKRRHAQDLSGVATAGLPNPERPGETLSQAVNADWRGYDDLVASHKQAEENSPEGRAMTDYSKAMLDFQQSLADRMGQWNQVPAEETFDPDAMRRLRFNGGTQI